MSLGRGIRNVLIEAQTEDKRGRIFNPEIVTGNKDSNLLAMCAKKKDTKLMSVPTIDLIILDWLMLRLL